MAEMDKTLLLKAIGNMLGTETLDASWNMETLQGGTLGDVNLVIGEAQTAEGAKPFSLVVKTQKKWERYGDPGSWRREYDIYQSNLPDELPGQIRLPRCFLLKEEEGIIRIWMEYINGKTSSRQLHAAELGLAAQRLGAFQADFYLHGRKDLPYVRSYPAVRSSFGLWSSHMAHLLAEPIEGFPDGLRLALYGYAKKSGELFASFDALPLTLCQGDVHHDNLILRERNGVTEVYLIDWDTAGYGYMGEDAVDLLMEAFVYSDRDISLLPDFKRHIMDSYCKGVRSRGIGYALNDKMVQDIFGLAWGFRIACLYLYDYKHDPSAQKRYAEILRIMLAGQ